MGNLLDKPNTEYIHAAEGTDHTLKFGVSSMQGWRPEMEDAHLIKTDIDQLPEHSLFAVFDGHGGKNAAIFAAENLAQALVNSEAFKTRTESHTCLEEALRQAFLQVDSDMRVKFKPDSNPTERSGCTAIAVLVTPTHVICANAGDSRAVLCREGNCLELSQDHKPWNDEEKQRIEKAGGCVTMKRVDGELAVSRALGDFQYKSIDLLPQNCKVTANPDITTFVREDGDQFVVLACDGIWDVLQNEEVCASITRYASAGESNPRLMCEELMCDCLLRHSRDNMSVITVLFPASDSLVATEGTGVMGLRAKREEAAAAAAANVTEES